MRVSEEERMSFTFLYIYIYIYIYRNDGWGGGKPFCNKLSSIVSK